MMHFRTSNPWVRFATETYWAARLPQLARIESAASWHGDEELFYAREPRITFRDTLIRCSPEWRQQKESAV